MGPWRVWCGVGVSLLLPNLGPKYRPATVGPTRRNSAVAPETTARSHESLQRADPGANAPSGLVIARSMTCLPSCGAGRWGLSSRKLLETLGDSDGARPGFETPRRVYIFG